MVILVIGQMGDRVENPAFVVVFFLTKLNLGLQRRKKLKQSRMGSVGVRN